MDSFSIVTMGVCGDRVAIAIDYDTVRTDHETVSCMAVHILVERTALNNRVPAPVIRACDSADAACVCVRCC